MTVEYDGTDFAGWQRQANAPTVQQHLEDALAQMTGAKVIVKGAGRTDAGVHALGQVAHFDTESAIPLDGFRRGLNSALPRTISIREVAEAAPDFDARFSALGKRYRYQVWNADSRSAVRDRFVWHHPRPLDAAAMQAASRPLAGRHDFAGFRAADCDRKTTVRTITRLEVARAGDLVTVEVEADAFLKNMVRIIVGTLLQAGIAKLGPDDVARALASRQRDDAGPTAPAKGLTLDEVFYPPSPL
jgi:tRNA pseudouridine38-40 synthase